MLLAVQEVDLTLADQIVHAVRYLQKGDRPCAVMGHVQVSCVQAQAHMMHMTCELMCVRVQGAASTVSSRQ